MTDYSEYLIDAHRQLKALEDAARDGHMAEVELAAEALLDAALGLVGFFDSSD